MRWLCAGAKRPERPFGEYIKLGEPVSYLRLFVMEKLSNIPLIPFATGGMETVADIRQSLFYKEHAARVFSLRGQW